MSKRHHLVILAFLLAIGVSTTFICAIAIDHHTVVRATAETSADVHEEDITILPEDLEAAEPDSISDSLTTPAGSSDNTETPAPAPGSAAGAAAPVVPAEASDEDLLNEVSDALDPRPVMSVTTRAAATPLVSTFDELLAAISENTINVITLDSDIIATDNIYIARNVEINLNGHSIVSQIRGARLLDIARGNVKLSGSGTINANGADAVAVRVYGSADPNAINYTTLTVGSDVTLEALDSEGSYGLLVSYTGSGKTAYGVTVNLNGHINGYQGMTINGNIQHTKNPVIINIADKASITANAVDGMAIYAAGYGAWYIDGATLSGGTGVGAKAGIFNFKGTKIIATGLAATGNPHNGSMDSTGSAIQLENHEAYAGSIRISVDGGEYSSKNASVFYEYSNNQAPSALKTLYVSGGTFTAASGQPVFRDLRAGAVTLDGGSYSSDVTSYLAPNQKIEKTEVNGQTTWLIKGSNPNKPTVPDSKPTTPGAGNLNSGKAIAAVATTTAAVIAAAIITLAFVVRCVFMHFREARAGGSVSGSSSSAKSSRSAKSASTRSQKSSRRTSSRSSRSSRK